MTYNPHGYDEPNVNAKRLPFAPRGLKHDGQGRPTFDADAPRVASPRIAYSIAEVCHMLDVSEDFFYDEVKRGRVRYVKVGTRSRVLAADFQAWVETFQIVSNTPAEL